MKNIFSIYFLILLSLPLKAQNIIKGTITDEDSIPLIGATVYLPEINKGTISDQNGGYELKDLPDAWQKRNAE